MSLEALDRGQVENETAEQRRAREDILAKSPRPTMFKLRAQMLKQGRTTELAAATDNMKVHVKVYASGGENGLHNHTDEDHFHLVMQGSARFYGPRGETVDCGQYEGIMLPAGAYYRFNATSDEPLVLLRVGCKTPEVPGYFRQNIYGEPIPTDTKENGQVEVIPVPGKFWGAGA
jgi:mannose-6-phosphate isomerase-like protein (cupin superfamily)